MTEIWMGGGRRAEVGYLIYSAMGVMKVHLPEEVILQLNERAFVN